MDVDDTGTGPFGLDAWERDVAKMATGWTIGMLVGITVLLLML